MYSFAVELVVNYSGLTVENESKSKTRHHLFFVPNKHLGKPKRILPQAVWTKPGIRGKEVFR